MRNALQITKMLKLTRIFIAIIQIGILYIFSLIGSFLGELLHLNFPGSLIGMGILFILLHLKVFPYNWVVIGGNWLLAELLLFFIPSVVAIMQYIQFLHREGLDLFLIILISTAAVMVSSGLTAEMITRKGGKAL
ncbi:CidA/LrgA family protein [Desulfosporosinus sp. SYSU MS00001]|uniref:CidA/LrgA family protein n=1 Tax=Desulfosporosinus sp. SYSU MS00001 TaxID=3416284 RepID=UPI003CE7C0FD